MQPLRRTDRVVYPVTTTRGVVDDLRKVRELYRKRTGMKVSVASWFGAFAAKTRADLEAQCRADGIPIDDDPPADGQSVPFHGLPDDAPSVD